MSNGVALLSQAIIGIGGGMFYASVARIRNTRQ
jgi:hypothetical protein